jgi:hypothetical protein
VLLERLRRQHIDLFGSLGSSPFAVLFDVVPAKVADVLDFLEFAVFNEMVQPLAMSVDGSLRCLALRLAATEIRFDGFVNGDLDWFPRT